MLTLLDLVMSPRWLREGTEMVVVQNQKGSPRPTMAWQRDALALG